MQKDLYGTIIYVDMAAKMRFHKSPNQIQSRNFKHWFLFPGTLPFILARSSRDIREHRKCARTKVMTGQQCKMGGAHEWRQ